MPGSSWLSRRVRGDFGRIHCDKTPPQIRVEWTRWLRPLGSAKGVGGNVSDLQMLQTTVQTVETQNDVAGARLDMSQAEGRLD